MFIKYQQPAKRLYRDEEPDEPSVIKQEDMDALSSEIEKLRNKNTELLSETKKNKESRRKAEAEAEAAATAEAEAAGNYKALHESEQKARIDADNRHAALVDQIAQRDISAAALAQMQGIADGDNVGILADYYAKRLKSTDDGVKVLDKDGNLTVSSLDDLTKEFAESSRFASLVKGRQSSGGGATGGGQSGGASDVNPFKKGDGFNLTKQAELLRTDPAKAAQYKSQL